MNPLSFCAIFEVVMYLYTVVASVGVLTTVVRLQPYKAELNNVSRAFEKSRLNDAVILPHPWVDYNNVARKHDA